MIPCDILVADDRVPRGEVWFVDRGTIVGKIVDLAEPEPNPTLEAAAALWTGRESYVLDLNATYYGPTMPMPHGRGDS